MNRLAEQRLAHSAALRSAIANDALKLHYQPQIRTIDGAIHGVEALARWHDPVLGEVSPAKFIALAEECGLIEQIGLCRFAKPAGRWRCGARPGSTSPVCRSTCLRSISRT